jgi:tRNA/tmRNA/rRNA uracil-C5-methylase (TrmA/RlmC/RlmD family)
MTDGDASRNHRRSGGTTSLSAGAAVELTIEKAAAGGRMIAHHEGQVVLVGGAIPGERVVARVDRVEKRLAFASAEEILESSPDRRHVPFDPSCGGCLYAHIAYAKQLELKADIIADAYARIGRLPVRASVPVSGSPERGYRMRARLHAHAGHAGFLKEGTHQLCDAAPTGQLLEASLESVHAALASIGESSRHIVSIEVSENVAADERALHIDLRTAETLPPPALAAAVAAAGLTGCSARSATGVFAQAGEPVVSDSLSHLTGGRATGTLRRHAASFFQANRFLVSGLLQRVMASVPDEGAVLDLYAGVGLFSVALAAAGRSGVVAVEGDRESGADLLRNAAPFGERLRAVVGSVEEYAGRERPGPQTVIVDPPRTGLSADAILRIVQLEPARIVYVSCDPPTMARDARRLVEGGYSLASIEGFDLFPNTPHVEVLGIFER